MSKPLTSQELATVKVAQWAVRRLADECPDVLEGEHLVAALMILLECQADERKNAMALLGIAAAAVAALVENERAQARGERVMAA